MIQADFRQQPLESQSAFDASTALALIFIDDHDPFPRPTQLDGTVGQVVLQRRRFAMFQDLVRTRLTHIDHRQPLCSLRFNSPK